uniref:Uncharacterized protein n=1 Tax=Glossina austeni TaxID=7395 RepID=A0A1A9UK38_GLOAU
MEADRGLIIYFLIKFCLIYVTYENALLMQLKSCKLSKVTFLIAIGLNAWKDLSATTTVSMFEADHHGPSPYRINEARVWGLTSPTFHQHLNLAFDGRGYANFLSR